MMTWKLLATVLASSLCIVTLCTSTARAGLIIAGNHTLQANTPNQIISILAGPSSPGEVAPGLNFNLVIDDGGSVLGGVDGNAPTITKVNLKPAGGLFALLPNLQTDVVNFPKLVQSTIVALSIPERPVLIPGTVLAEITLDTTGLTSGTWIIDLDGTDIFPTSDFAGEATTISNGILSIAVVPEPSCLLLVGVSIVLGLRRRGCALSRKVLAPVHEGAGSAAAFSLASENLSETTFLRQLPCGQKGEPGLAPASAAG